MCDCVYFFCVLLFSVLCALFSSGTVYGHVAGADACFLYDARHEASWKTAKTEGGKEEAANSHVQTDALAAAAAAAADAGVKLASAVAISVGSASYFCCLLLLLSCLQQLCLSFFLSLFLSAFISDHCFVFWTMVIQLTEKKIEQNLLIFACRRSSSV